MLAPKALCIWLGLESVDIANVVFAQEWLIEPITGHDLHKIGYGASSAELVVESRWGRWQLDRATRGSQREHGGHRGDNHDGKTGHPPAHRQPPVVRRTKTTNPC